MAIYQKAICRMEFLTDRTKNSRFAENITKGGKQRRPLGRRVAQCSLRSQTFACPFTSVLSVIVCREDDVSVVKTMFWQIANAINF